MNKEPTIAEIQVWVKRGNSQSARNCRILLREIERLRELLNKRGAPV